MLANPPHGYGSGFNPCLDCKILMLQRAKEIMEEGSFQVLATGEVVGQRPMTQQRHLLRHIEKQTGLTDRILRPLSAKKLPPTVYEREGLVDREKLLDLSGRGRKRQLALAREWGLEEIPSPAGGCLLTDPSLAPRFKRFFALKKGKVTPLEAELLTFGRHFELPSGGWLMLGRNEAENRRLQRLSPSELVVLKLQGLPGPTGILLIKGSDQDLIEAAKLLKRYASRARSLPKVPVKVRSPEGEDILWV
jgi:hypothetical protein